MAHATVDHGTGHDLDPDAHPDRSKLYVAIAIFLAILTAVEVGLYYVEGKIDQRIIFASLMLLMAVKFWVVISFFMHLRFDKKFLSVTFYSGLVLALAVYIAILTAFRFWTPATHMVPSVITLF